jgi:type I restriction enzyme S subunit
MSSTLREDWGLVELAEIGEIYSGGTPKTKNEEYWGDEVSWISPSDLSGYASKFISKGQKSITELGLSKSSAKLIPAGSILFSSRAPIGYVVIANNDLSTNQGFKSISPSSFIFNEFVYYYLKSSKNLAEQNASGTTFKEISKKAFSELPFPLPSLPEQRAIVAKIEELFSDLDKGIADLKRAQDQLKVYRQAVLKKAFEGGWKRTSVDELFDFVGGGTPSKGKKDYWNGNIPWASVKDIKGDYLEKTQDCITEKGLKNSSANLALKDDVVLITRISPGKSLVTTIDTAINQDLKIVKPKNPMFNKYIHYLFKSIERICIKLSSGTTVKGINLTNLKSIEIPVIEEREQHQIVQEIESRLSVCDKVEESITESLEKAKALRQSILKKAFEGTLLSEEEIATCKAAPDYEPASVLLEKIKAETLRQAQDKKKKK